MKLSRKTLMAASAGAFASTAIFRFAAGAAEFSYKWAHQFPQTHPGAMRSQEAATKIAQESNGRLEITMYPNAVLGGGAQQIEQARLGAVELAGASYDFLSATVPLCGLTAVPFAFATYKDAWNAVDGPFGKALSTAVVKSGLYMFDRVYEAGLRQITNSVRPIHVPGDLRGLKLRANAAPMEVATFKSFGAIPTVVDGSQLYVAVQTHVVDGTDLGLTIFEAYKLYEVQKYISMVNHSWSGYPMVANPGAWQRLPANLRTIVERNVDASAMLERADMQRQESSTRTSLESKGMITNDADSSAFKAAVRTAGLYPQWRAQFGADAFELLEKAVGKLA